MLYNIFGWFLHNGLISFLLRCRQVSISREGEIGCFINCIASNFFSCSNDARIYFKNLLLVLSFLLMVLFYILLQKCSLIWITFCARLRLGISRHAISTLFYVFISNYYLLWCSSLILLGGQLKPIQVPFLVPDNASQFAIRT